MKEAKKRGWPKGKPRGPRTQKFTTPAMQDAKFSKLVDAIFAAPITEAIKGKLFTILLDSQRQ